MNDWVLMRKTLSGFEVRVGNGTTSFSSFDQAFEYFQKCLNNDRPKELWEKFAETSIVRGDAVAPGMGAADRAKILAKIAKEHYDPLES